MLPELDPVTLGVFALSFAVCAALVAAVSVFGAREQTFEEAVEEQKKKNQSHNKTQNKNKSLQKQNGTAAANPQKEVRKRNNKNKVGKTILY